MVADFRYDRLDQLRSTLAYPIYPAQLLAEIPHNVADWLLTNINSYTHLLTQHAQLNEELLELQGRMLRFNALAEENTQLRAQLGASLRVGERVSLAEITNADFSPYSQHIWINKGSRGGVSLGQAVIDAHAIMGQITEVTPFRAKVTMITDPMHAIPVRVLRSGLLTVAKGTGRVDSLELPFLPNSADISVGDLLISSGLGGRYPADYPVARVTQIDQDSTGAPVVYAMPLAKLAQSRDVMLVWQIDQRGAASMDADEGAQDGESLLDPLKLSLPDNYNSEESD